MFNQNEFKKSVIFLISLSVFVFLSTYFGAIEWKTFNNCIEVSGNELDNNYNNSLAYPNRFCRVHDKLYYSYLKNTRHHGIMEISSGGTRRIYRIPLYWLTAPLDEWSRMYKYNSGFYIPSDNLVFFDSDKKEFINTGIINNRNVEGWRMAFYDNNVYYKSYNPTQLVKNNKKGSEVTISEDIDDFYIYKDNIYYTKSSSDKIQMLFKCDLEGNQNKQIFSYKVSDTISYINNYLIEKNYLIFSNSNSEYKSFVYKCKLDDSSNSSLEQICDKEVSSFNAFDGKVYACTSEGIYLVDFEANQKISLTNKNSKSCFIVDDKWVYFISDDAVLWHVTNDGTTTEKVFG